MSHKLFNFHFIIYYKYTSTLTEAVGVGQVFIVRPILFTIFINEVPDNVSTYSFADDATTVNSE